MKTFDAERRTSGVLMRYVLLLLFASPVVAAIMMSGALLVWRTGVRHYTSTGS